MPPLAGHAVQRAVQLHRGYIFTPASDIHHPHEGAEMLHDKPEVTGFPLVSVFAQQPPVPVMTNFFRQQEPALQRKAFRV